MFLKPNDLLLIVEENSLLLRMWSFNMAISAAILATFMFININGHRLVVAEWASQYHVFLAEDQCIMQL